MNVDMLKPGAIYYHVTHRMVKSNQPHTFVDSVLVEAELSDSGAKNTFPPNLRIKISETIFELWAGHLTYTSWSLA